MIAKSNVFRSRENDHEASSVVHPNPWCGRRVAFRYFPGSRADQDRRIRPDDRRRRGIRSKHARRRGDSRQGAEREGRRPRSAGCGRLWRRCRQARAGRDRRQAAGNTRSGAGPARQHFEPGQPCGVAGGAGDRNAADRHHLDGPAHHHAGQPLDLPVHHPGHSFCREPRHVHGEEISGEKEVCGDLRKR
jgi:hypothetical protein